MTLITCPIGASLSALMASLRSGFLATAARSFLFEAFDGHRLGVGAQAQDAFGVDADDQGRGFVGAGLLGLGRFGQGELEGGLLLEGGRHHQEDQQDDEDVDQRDNDHRRGLPPFASVELHGVSGVA